MVNKNPSKKSHSVGSILLVVILLVSIISFGFYTEGNDSIIENADNEITWAAAGMERVNFKHA